MDNPNLPSEQNERAERKFAEPKHTPGPWTFSPYMQNVEATAAIRSLGLEPTRKLTNEGQAIVLAADGRVALVDCQTEFKRGKGYQTDCEERSANARLIAAAPDLLEAGRLVMASAQSISSAQTEAFAAMRAAIAKATGAA